MRSTKNLVDHSLLKTTSQENPPESSKFKTPLSLFVMCGIAIIVFLGVGIWLFVDLRFGYSAIMRDRESLAVQTSGLLSQRFFNTLTAADYVLRDITSKITVEEINLASSDQDIQHRLSAFVREKLDTLPNVYGLGFLDKQCIFVAAADENIIGIKSNSKLNAKPGQVLERKTYVEYVPATKSANKQPAILVSRPILSDTGAFEGGALAAIMLSTAQDWILTYEVGPYDTIAMFDDQGILLAHNPNVPNAIGARLGYLTGQSKIDLQDTDPSFLASSAIDGRERIYGVSKVENIPIYIVVGFDKEQALREWQRRLWQTTAGFFALMVLAFLMLRSHRDVLKKQQELRRLSVTDSLTGIANRRQILLLGENEITRALRYKANVSVLMIDIDHFKSINDLYGHPTGDRVIQFLAHSMVANLRSFDIAGRLGGEEFVVILPETRADGAFAFANRLREILESSDVVVSDAGEPVHFTVSIGGATLNEGDSTFDHLLGRADKALYDAKTRGRNRVDFAS